MTYREQVPGKLRPFLTPGWLALHLLSVVLVVTMVLLGRWQLDVSNAKHFSLQNFGYALQWWAFSIFVVLMWRRVVRDRAGRESSPASARDPETDAASAPGVPYRRYVMPQSSTAPAPVSDGEHAAYNDYLARLADADRSEPKSDRPTSDRPTSERTAP